MTVRILVGDCRDVLRSLGDESVQTCISSPPYYALRDYGGGDAEIGREASPDEYVQHLVEVFREVKRVLRRDGTVFLNLGDSYSGGGGYWPDAPSNVAGSLSAKRGPDGSGTTPYKGRKPAPGLKPKDLIGIPWAVAFALRADGWYLRSDIVWAKPNPMPESVTDRPTKSHEYLFLLTKRASYYYDNEAVRETYSMSSWTAEREMAGELARGRDGIRSGEKGLQRANGAADGQRSGATAFVNGGYNHAGRNLRSVWTIATTPFRGSHFAVMPTALVEPCIRAGTSERGCCPHCGTGWRRVVERTASSWGARKAAGHAGNVGGSVKIQRLYGATNDFDNRAGGFGAPARNITLGWQPACKCPPHEPVPCRVLDPFAGAGTTLLVADRLGRDAIGVELSAEYAAMAKARLDAEAGMFSAVEVLSLEADAS